jgi:hypothetical protein
MGHKTRRYGGCTRRREQSQRKRRALFSLERGATQSRQAVVGVVPGLRPHPGRRLRSLPLTETVRRRFRRAPRGPAHPRVSRNSRRLRSAAEAANRDAALVVDGGWSSRDTGDVLCVATHRRLARRREDGRVRAVDGPLPARRSLPRLVRGRHRHRRTPSHAGPAPRLSGSLAASGPCPEHGHRGRAFTASLAPRADVPGG